MDTCTVANINVLRIISKLLKVRIKLCSEYFIIQIVLKLDENGIRDGLLKRTIFAHGEAVVTPLSQQQAYDVR
jgi:hypothetical protein